MSYTNPIFVVVISLYSSLIDVTSGLVLVCVCVHGVCRERYKGCMYVCVFVCLFDGFTEL